MSLSQIVACAPCQNKGIDPGKKKMGSSNLEKPQKKEVEGTPSHDAKRSQGNSWAAGLQKIQSKWEEGKDYR
jgi:hypothetical protein